MYHIALVEDEVDLSNLMKTYLEKESYQVTPIYQGQDTLAYLEMTTEKVHLWILDIMLGDTVSGYDIIKQIREKDPHVPVIFTSARDQDLDKIIGLELGSDDYLTKPYSPKELVLRVNNIIKRAYKENNTNIVEYLEYKFDIDRRIVLEKEK